MRLVMTMYDARDFINRVGIINYHILGMVRAQSSDTGTDGANGDISNGTVTSHLVALIWTKALKM